MRIYDYMKGILGAMGVGEDVGVPEPSWRIEEYLKAIYDKLKEGGGGSNKFIVTLTPTSPDFSGTMDKTVSEIAAAYEAGQEIWFRIYESPTHYYDLKVTLTNTAASDDYPAFGAYGVLTEKFILFKTDVIGSTYSTEIYLLTPAS